VLSARGLRAEVGGQVLLDGVDLQLAAGRVLAVVGRSGSGKTTLGYAVQGESPGGATLSGSVELAGTDLLRSCAQQRRSARAAMLPQHPAAALDPIRRVGEVLRELAALRHDDREARHEAVRAALTAARLDPDSGLLRRFPHQLSGGQQQRLPLALALITRPQLVVLDEPTTGADTRTKAELAELFADLAAGGTALLLLTHDLPLARRLADDVLVLHRGRVVERGTRALHEPEHPVAREILAAEPDLTTEPVEHSAEPVLTAEGLGRSAADGTALLRDVDLTLHAGRCAAVIGPSGAGKTTLARCLAGLTRPGTGHVRLGEVGLARAARARPREHRRQVQYVHQDAPASFDPKRPLLRQVARTAELLRGLTRDRARREAADLLAEVGLEPAQLHRRPPELSGGQLHRAAAVRALLARPSVLICDEITAALDAVHQAELLRLLARAKRDGTAVVLISHDLAPVAALADDVHLLHSGRLVESAPPHRLLAEPSSAEAADLVAAAREHHSWAAHPPRA